jgi:hypothetical protein
MQDILRDFVYLKLFRPYFANLWFSISSLLCVCVFFCVRDFFHYVATCLPYVTCTAKQRNTPKEQKALVCALRL